MCEFLKRNHIKKIVFAQRGFLVHPLLSDLERQLFFAACEEPVLISDRRVVNFLCSIQLKYGEVPSTLVNLRNSASVIRTFISSNDFTYLDLIKTFHLRFMGVFWKKTNAKVVLYSNNKKIVANCYPLEI